MKSTLITLALIAANSSALASVCRIQGSLSGFSVYLDQKMYSHDLSLYDARQKMDALVKNQACLVSAPTDACAIRPSKIGYDVFQGTAHVISFWFVDDAAIMRDEMAAAQMCVIAAPTEYCSINPIADGYEVLIGKVNAGERSTLKEAQDLQIQIFDAKLCL